jgi:hypothetical protein
VESVKWHLYLREPKTRLLTRDGIRIDRPVEEWGAILEYPNRKVAIRQGQKTKTEFAVCPANKRLRIVARRDAVPANGGADDVYYSELLFKEKQATDQRFATPKKAMRARAAVAALAKSVLTRERRRAVTEGKMGR